jgi:hypothetical protein
MNLASDILHFHLYRAKALDELSRHRVLRVNVALIGFRDPLDGRAEPFQLGFDWHFVPRA